MHDDVVVERVVAVARAIDDLVGNAKVFGGNFFAQATDGRKRDAPKDAKALECPYIGGVWHVRGRNAVAAPVTWQKCDAATLVFCNRYRIRGLAKWRVDVDRLDDANAVEIA